MAYFIKRWPLGLQTNSSKVTVNLKVAHFESLKGLLIKYER